MSLFNKIYQYVNILSLDVVAGSIICSLFFAKLFSVSTSAYTITALAFSVWAIYTIDHLKDARAISGLASTDRHRFHQKNFKLLAIIVSIVIIVGVILTRFIPEEISSFGLVLGSLVVIYLILHPHAKFLKEFFVAALYTGGVILPALVVTDLLLKPIHYVIIIQFFLTALANLLLFSLFDFEHDQEHQQYSFVTWFGRSPSRTGILILGATNFVSGLCMFPFNQTAAIIVMLMNAVLLVIGLNQKHFRRNNFYRIVGDAIFLLPILYLI